MTTTAGQHYHVLRTGLTELAADLTPEHAATPVPALPGWTVRDTYAHLAGISADFVNGTVGDVRDPSWTAGHLSARQDRSLAEICAEWDDNAPQAETTMDADIAAGRHRSVFAVFDIFHHSHDILGALGRRGERDTPEAAFVVATMAGLRGAGWGRDGHPTIELSTGSGAWRFGPPEGAPTAALSTSDFELARILIGRRSRAQMLAAGWSGDPEPIVDLLPTFGPPVTDLTE